ncbi:hypothetical protein M011DRAFT_491375 [Sporormia fimetaria CBS 119925]|uniref:F-box domain-containing protein n=1 Tax=Sporormia fimetaria CBS 119925 TaxID=1340428 RepID=A0A6A6VPR0_9PLEO|nr:hypothetical protein M011DRAFT_491375 [Sporormia fimetaria CBS 119925]
MDPSQLPPPVTPPPCASPSPAADDGALSPAALPPPTDTRISQACGEEDGDSGRFLPQPSAGDPAKPTTEAPSDASPEITQSRKSPLQLLGLPVDILKDIIQQLPHTNDLTSLALCHSALHRLTIPFIYSRFDIVWPDESTHTESRAGVDALTYGLATLVMGGDAFPHQARHPSDVVPPRSVPNARQSARSLYPIPRRRFGNYYAQFTKKFSLGNGPPLWVQEYMITKEGGKMLGTLVALAVAQMINLETFVWDMPTGVLRDVWLALSSLAHRTDGEDCRLERLWVRWHDNSQESPVPPPPAPPIVLNNAPPPPPPPIVAIPSGMTVPQHHIVPAHSSSIPASAIDRIEYPTFSVIPALKSLSVLDIDELPYLDEMSILIARSQDKLRELRVGIASQAQERTWVAAWAGPGTQQVDYSTTSTATSSISEKRLGGVLGILVGRVHNLRHTVLSERDPTATSLAQPGSVAPLPNSPGASHQAAVQNRDSAPPPADATGGGDQASHQLGDRPASAGLGTGADQDTNPPSHTSPNQDATVCGNTSSPSEPLLDGKLKLEVLELERVPLSVSVLMNAFDWSVLTALTLLGCREHEQLWKSLRRTYTPRPATSSPSGKAYKASYSLRFEYSLALKKIHTNTVSPSLIAFLKETLAPNTLEVLFLQDSQDTSSVTVDAIYRGPLRRHRASLKKVMIDSSEKDAEGRATTSMRWRRWMLNRDIVTFVTSGKMSSLREFAFCIDYKDWHHFLQRLPQIPHLRSLYIPFIADHAHGNNLEARELAMQILDIVHLRPEIELCYMGISTKCFEILENRPSNYDLRRDSQGSGTSLPNGLSAGYTPHDPIMLSDDESALTEDDVDDDDESDMGMGAPVDVDVTDSDLSDDVRDDSSEDEEGLDGTSGPQLRIREILFYEEKIETLRARHGTLKP